VTAGTFHRNNVGGGYTREHPYFYWQNF